MCKKLAWPAVFGIAMGFLEAAAVVYLRQMFYPEGFKFPLAPIKPDIILLTEILREAATLIMLISIACIQARRLIVRFAYFIFVFGIWDIFYYIFLKLALNWPVSVFDWDILFLIPIVWTGPVIAPVICSLTMIGLAGEILYFEEKGIIARFEALEWALLICGAFLIFLSFIRDFGLIILKNNFLPRIPSLINDPEFIRLLSAYVPWSFNWPLFWAGEALILGACLIFAKKRKY
ncbi:MAG: hypothetical protein HY746_10125 [Elusimicrobia bacterium]|nr:hypothetical protein [Elusimicrobiota bacterium]